MRVSAALKSQVLAIQAAMLSTYLPSLLLSGFMFSIASMPVALSPLQPAELILGKTIPVAVIGLVDLALISSVAVFWFAIPFRGSMLELLPAAIIYIMAGLSFGLLISTISKSQQEAFLTMFLFLLPAIILSGFFYPISSMPVAFQWLTLPNPLRHFLEIVRGIFLKGSGVTELWPQYLALAAIAVGGLGFAIQRFAKTTA